MSELRSIVVIVCCAVGFVLFIGGVWAYQYATYPYPQYIGYVVYPYRIYSVPFVICGIALLVSGVMVYLGGSNVKVDVV